MGTFAGHVAPAVLLLVYGLFLHLHSVHAHFLLSHPYRRGFFHPPTASKLLSSRPPPSSFVLSRLLLSHSLRRAAYAAAIVVAVVLIPVEISHWNGSWMAMASPQHATMYAMVALSAAVGLCMDTELLPETARVVVGPCFWLCGFMFAGHAQHGEYNTAIHVTLAHLFYAAGTFYVLYSAALSACRTAAAYFVSPCSPASSLSRVTPPSPTYSLLLSILVSSLSLFSRLVSLSIVVCGTWMLHIAFKLFAPFSLPPFLTTLLSSTPAPSPAPPSPHSTMDASMHGEHSTAVSGSSSLDAESHTLLLTLAWHYLGVVSVALLLELLLRRALVGETEWEDGAGGGGSGGGAAHRSYERVAKAYDEGEEDEEGEDGWRTSDIQHGQNAGG